MRPVVVLAAAALLLGGCTTQEALVPAAPVQTPVQTPAQTPSLPTAPSPSLDAFSPAPAPSPTTDRERFDARAAMADVRRLAGDIGPRLATAPAFRRAGRLVGRRFAELGYDVRREAFPVPAGDSWGVPVEAGRSFNVVARPDGFDGGSPYLLLGAHLDTVAVAPGAEDNASGVAVLLELARLAATEQTRLPVVLVAFGAEEPRGTGDDMHHFGSVHHVATMSQRHRDNLHGMVSLDRVGVGTAVPVCTGPLSPPSVQQSLLDAAERVDVPTAACENTASDHWSFEKAGYPVARLGSTSYAAYHSAADLPGVVDAEQLGRTGRVAWSWLQ
jgi:hypothetical protein